MHGHPPKVIWLRLGNCSTNDIERFLRVNAADILAFATDEEGALLALS